MDQFSLAALCVFFLLVTIFSYSWILRRKLPPLPPGPRSLPIVGYLPFLNHNLHIQFTDLARKYGPIYTLRLGSKLCVVVSSYDLIKQVVRDQDTVLANRDPPLVGMVATEGMDILNSPYGPHWRRLRKLFVREMLSNSHLEASYALRKDEIRKAVKNVYRNVGSVIDIGELIFVTEFKVILSLLWGGTIDGEMHDRIAAEFRDKVDTFVDLLGKPNLSDFFPVLAKFDFQGIAAEMKGLLPSIDTIIDTILSDRLKTMNPRQDDEIFSGAKRTKDFVHILLDLKDQNVDGESIDFSQIKGLLMDIIIGGTDTTATIVEWVMAEMLNNPHEMKKVQQELADVVGPNNLVEESHVSKLQYLDAVVRESFRLHPPLPLLIPRMPSQTCTLGGYTIPKGCRVVLNAWSGCSDPQVWENPLEFKPERFLNDTGKCDYMGNNFNYLPFGSGRRVCPGLPLAERMVMYFVATLLHSFDWGLPQGQKFDMAEKFGVVMKKSTPLYAIPSKRLPDSSMYE